MERRPVYISSLLVSSQSWKVILLVPRNHFICTFSVDKPNVRFRYVIGPQFRVYVNTEFRFSDISHFSSVFADGTLYPGIIYFILSDRNYAVYVWKIWSTNSKRTSFAVWDVCQKMSSLGHDILKAIHDFSSFQSVDHVLWAIIFLPAIRMHIKKKRLATHSRLRWESEPL